MPRSVMTWYCSTCGLKLQSEEDALNCESQHYPIGKIIGVYYEEGRRAPAKIQVEISLDGGNSFEKDVFYSAPDEGWGAKKTSKDG